MKSVRMTAVWICMLLTGGVATGQTPEPTAPRIRVHAQTLRLESGDSNRDRGQILWSREYELESGHTITITYRDQVLEKDYSLDLTFAVPEQSHPPEQEVAVRLQWSRPDRRTRARDFLIRGELGTTLFSDPKGGWTVHLRVIPRILWSENAVGSARGGAMLLRDAYLIVNDRVIRRDLAASGEELVLRDRMGPIARISTSPLEAGTSARGEIDGARATLEIAGLRLDIINRQSITGRRIELLYAEFVPGRAIHNIDLETVNLVSAISPHQK